MKLYKKLLCGALAAAMVLSMAACDSKPKTRDYSDDDDDDTPSTTTTTTTGEEGEDGEDDPPGRLLDFCLTIPDDYMKAENEALKLTGTKNELKDYSANIKLPRIAKAKVTVMMSIDWQYLQKNNVESDPFAQYHATLMWRSVYADQAGDVEIVRVAENEMTDRVVIAAATGTAPDILPANYDLTYPKWSAAGLTASLVPYKDYLGLNEQFYYEDLYNRDFLKNYFQWGGEAHAISPLKEADRQYVIYNKTMFLDKGERTPLDRWAGGSWTWDAFVSTAQAMTDIDNNVYGFTGWGLFPYFAQYPMISVDRNTGLASLNLDANGKYMKYMSAVYDFYQKSGAVKLDPNDVQGWMSLFPRGTAAMAIGNKAAFKRIVENAKKIGGDTFGIAPMPSFTANGETLGISNATLWGYSIAKGAKNPEGAATYIRLETMVMRNIDRELEGSTWYDKNLEAGEKGMLSVIADYPICIDATRGIGDCCNIVDSNIVPAFYYMEAEQSVTAIFDAYRGMLQAEIDLYNEDVRESR